MSDKINWLQWTSRRTGVTKAFAVDADMLDAKGVARAVNGSAIPDDAVPAKRSTERDEFCVQILESRARRAAAKKEKTASKPAPAKTVKTRAVRKDKGQPRKARAAA